MEMRNWVTPEVTVQGFEMNDYVAASCWLVACSYDEANKVEQTMEPTNPNNYGNNNYNDGQTHAAGQCGTSGNQVIVTDANNVVTGMYEINSDTGVRNLTCTLYSDATYENLASYSNVQTGDYIYWTTALSNGTTWYHQGSVGAVDSYHPSRGS